MWQIWREGWDTYPEHEHSDAELMGTVEAETLQEACTILAATDKDFAKYFDPIKMTYWGCRLFDNEVDARKFTG